MVDLTTSPTASPTLPGVVTTTTGTGMSAVTTPTATLITTSSPLVQVTPSFVQTLWPGAVSAADLLSSGTTGASGEVFVVLGVGNKCALVGARRGGIAEPPMAAPDSGTTDPSLAYGRFVAVFRVDAVNGNAATFVGCGRPSGMGLCTADCRAVGYYSANH